MANSSLLSWLRKKAIREHMMDRGETYRNRPYPELIWCHPDWVENFGCKREELVPQRDTLFSDITVFLLTSVQGRYASFWAQTKFHTQAWNPHPHTVHSLGHLPTGGVTRVVLAQLSYQGAILLYQRAGAKWGSGMGFFLPALQTRSKSFWSFSAANCLCSLAGNINAECRSGNTLFLSLLVHLPLPEAPLWKAQVSSCPESYSLGALRQVHMRHCVPRSHWTCWLPPLHLPSLVRIGSRNECSYPAILCKTWRFGL